MTKALFNMTSTITAIRVGDRVDGRDGPLGTVAGTRVATAEHPDSVLVRLSRLFGLVHSTRLVPLAWVKEPSTDARRVTLDATRAEVAGCPPLRAEEKRYVETPWDHGQAASEAADGRPGAKGQRGADPRDRKGKQ